METEHQFLSYLKKLQIISKQKTKHYLEELWEDVKIYL